MPTSLEYSGGPRESARRLIAESAERLTAEIAAHQSEVRSAQAIADPHRRAAELARLEDQRRRLQLNAMSLRDCARIKGMVAPRV